LHILAEKKGQLFESLLAKLPQVKEFRRKGLMIAIEFGDRELNFKLIHQCMEKGILSDWFLFCDTAMRIAPPLIITEEEIEKACDIIKAVVTTNRQ